LKVPPVPQGRVRAESSQERLLKRVVGRVAPEHPPEVREHRALLLLVEAFERRDGHGFHHSYKR
jgi:hypothetical protein